MTYRYPRPGRQIATYDYHPMTDAVIDLDNRRLRHMESCVGKTIKNFIAYGNQELFIVFDDNTFIVIKTEDSDGIMLFTVDNNPLLYDLLHICLLTEEQFQAEERAITELDRKTQREEDLKTLSYLRKKYENNV